jgi:uncharacterized protein
LIRTSLLLLLILGCAAEQPQQVPFADRPSVCFDGECFWVEIANTSMQRTMGLMHREHLAADSGMLFVFEQPGYYPFWMKNTLIPLDMFWMDEGFQVDYIHANATPCKTAPCPFYGASRDAKYVLELNAGASANAGITVGDKAAFVWN